MAANAKRDARWRTNIGKRVFVEGKGPGVLEHFGPVDFKPGVWCGVVLDEPTGKHDGMVGDTRFFVCEPDHGVFMPVDKVVLQDDPLAKRWKALLKKNAGVSRGGAKHARNIVAGAGAGTSTPPTGSPVPNRKSVPAAKMASTTAKKPVKTPSSLPTPTTPAPKTPSAAFARKTPLSRGSTTSTTSPVTQTTKAPAAASSVKSRGAKQKLSASQPVATPVKRGPQSGKATKATTIASKTTQAKQQAGSAGPATATPRTAEISGSSKLSSAPAAIEAAAHSSPCQCFLPHAFRADQCASCFNAKSDHSKAAVAASGRSEKVVEAGSTAVRTITRMAVETEHHLQQTEAPKLVPAQATLTSSASKEQKIQQKSEFKEQGDTPSVQLRQNPAQSTLSPTISTLKLAAVEEPDKNEDALQRVENESEAQEGHRPSSTPADDLDPKMATKQAPESESLVEREFSFKQTLQKVSSQEASSVALAPAAKPRLSVTDLNLSVSVKDRARQVNVGVLQTVESPVAPVVVEKSVKNRISALKHEASPVRLASNSMVAEGSEVACDSFQPQAWRKNKCMECHQLLEAHSPAARTGAAASNQHAPAKLQSPAREQGAGIRSMIDRAEHSLTSAITLSPRELITTARVRDRVSQAEAGCLVASDSSDDEAESVAQEVPIEDNLEICHGRGNAQHILSEDQPDVETDWERAVDAPLAATDANDAGFHTEFDFCGGEPGAHENGMQAAAHSIAVEDEGGQPFVEEAVQDEAEVAAADSPLPPLPVLSTTNDLYGVPVAAQLPSLYEDPDAMYEEPSSVVADQLNLKTVAVDEIDRPELHPEAGAADNVYDEREDVYDERDAQPHIVMADDIYEPELSSNPSSEPGMVDNIYGNIEIEKSATRSSHHAGDEGIMLPDMDDSGDSDSDSDAGKDEVDLPDLGNDSDVPMAVPKHPSELTPAAFDFNPFAAAPSAASRPVAGDDSNPFALPVSPAENSASTANAFNPFFNNPFG